MLLTEEDLEFSPAPIGQYAPTSATAANQLNAGSGTLESLLNLAVGGYTSVLQAKATADANKAALANANKTGVNSTPTAAPSTGFTLSPKVVLVGVGVLVAGIAAVVALRKP